MSFIPNTTPTPNWLYNGEMQKMNETELKVVLLVTRKTLGWFDPATKDRKMQDYISQKQFKTFTGQESEAIANAIQSSVEHGWIVARDREGNLCDTREKRARRKVWYRLGSIFTDKISGSESALDEKVGGKSGSENTTHLVRKANSTKVTIQKKEHSDVPSQDVSSIIESFKGVNPSYKVWFANKTQRAAIGRLIETHGMERLQRVIAFLPQSNTIPFVPTITSPYVLEQKWADLQAGLTKLKNKATTNQPKVIL